MWKCPKSNQKFVNTNQWHLCGQYIVTNFLILFMLSLIVICSCSKKDKEAKSNDENITIQKLLDSYYLAMSERDWLAYKEFFIDDGTLTTIWQGPQDSLPQISTYSITEFLAQTKDGPDSQPIFEEKLVSADIKVNNNLANAWVQYKAKFGTSDNLIEWKGMDLFSIIKYSDEWKIVSIAYEAEE